jgi:hypothetical protein
MSKNKPNWISVSSQLPKIGDRVEVKNYRRQATFVVYDNISLEILKNEYDSWRPIIEE